MRRTECGKALGCVLAALAVLVLLALVVGAWWASTYNRFVKNQEAVRAQWGQVQNVYQRRMDLIPNLVETVKGASNYERQTLEAVIDARARATQVTVSADKVPDAATLEAFQSSQGVLSTALGRLLAVAEAYPDLKANRNYLSLQDELAGTENRIAQERRRFNEVAQEFNRTVRSFPANLVASLSGFEPVAYFSAEAGAEKPPKVQF